MSGDENVRILAGDYARLGWRAIREMATTVRAKFAVYLLLQLIVALLPGLQVWAVRILTNRLAGGASVGVITWIVAALAVVLGLQRSAIELSNSYGRMSIRAMQGQLRAEVAQAMAVSTPAELADPAQTNAAKSADAAFKEYGGYYARNLIASAQGLIALLFLLASLWPISPWSATLLLLSMIVIIPFLGRVARLETATYPTIIRENRYAGYYMEQLLYQRTGQELVSLGSAHRVAGLAERRLRQAVQLGFGLEFRSMGFQLGSGILGAAIAGVAVWLAATSSAGGVGGAAAGVVAVLSGSFQAAEAAGAWGVFMSSTGPVRAAYSFLDSRAGRTRQDVRAMEVALLAAEAVTYTYPGAAGPAVVNASISVARGEMVAFVGLNGAGKTTLINCLAGLFRPDDGMVTLDGRGMAALSDGERLGSVAMLTQEFGRYEFTVRENVSLGSPSGDVTDDQIWAALRAARADGFVRALPEGLDTQLGQQWGGIGLSGGQWQRLALARVALRDAPIWLLDEPTSAVDAVTEEQIFADLATTKAGRITIIVSHRAWTLRAMDRIYVVDAGRIVESGSYAELMAAEGVFAQMFRFQAEAAADGQEAEIIA